MLAIFTRQIFADLKVKESEEAVQSLEGTYAIVGRDARLET